MTSILQLFYKKNHKSTFSNDLSLHSLNAAVDLFEEDIERVSFENSDVTFAASDGSLGLELESNKISMAASSEGKYATIIKSTVLLLHLSDWLILKPGSSEHWGSKWCQTGLYYICLLSSVYEGVWE